MEITNSIDQKGALIGTMPKSGTYLVNYFFYFLHNFIIGADTSKIEVPLPDKFHLCGAHNIFSPSIGLELFLAGHTTCPGFETKLGKYGKPWEALRFWVDGYFYAKRFVDERPTVFYPEVNPEVRIVHVYRNPLDQSVSAWRHSLNHTNEANRFYIAPDGSKTELKNPKDFLHLVGLDAYLKLFVTYKVVQENYPYNILMVSYEDLVTSNEATFVSILKFLGHDPFEHNTIGAVREALLCSSPAYLQMIEKMTGNTLAKDQKGSGESHIRDGSIGGWKAYFGEQDLIKVEEKLRIFDLSLSEFQIDQSKVFSQLPEARFVGRLFEERLSRSLLDQKVRSPALVPRA